MGFDELVTVKSRNGEARLRQSYPSITESCDRPVFEGTTGLSPSETRTRFLGHSLEVPVSTEMLGRVMNSFGEPIDGHPRFFTEEKRDVNGYPLNPVSREYPKEFIQTGISAIDGLCSLVADRNCQFSAVQVLRTMNLRLKSLGKPRFAAEAKTSTLSSLQWV